MLLALTLALYFLAIRGYTILFGALVGWIPALFLDAKLGRVLFPPMIRLDKRLRARKCGNQTTKLHITVLYI
jgi:hypothetical protein